MSATPGQVVPLKRKLHRAKYNLDPLLLPQSFPQASAKTRYVMLTLEGVALLISTAHRRFDVD